MHTIDKNALQWPVKGIIIHVEIVRGELKQLNYKTVKTAYVTNWPSLYNQI